MEAHVVIPGSVGTEQQQQQANTTAPPESSDKSLNRHKCANLPTRGGSAAAATATATKPELLRLPLQPTSSWPAETGTLPVSCDTCLPARSITGSHSSSAGTQYGRSIFATQQSSPTSAAQPASRYYVARLSLANSHARRGRPQLPYFLLSALLLALMHLCLTGEPTGCLAVRRHPTPPNEFVAWRRNSAGGHQSGREGAGAGARVEAEALGREAAASAAGDARLSHIHRKLAEVRRELELEIMATWARTRQVALDSPCLRSADCTQGIPNSHCNLTSFTCVCLPHHVRLNSSMCLAPSLLGYPCLTDAQCQYKVANSYCSQQGLCECQSNFVTYRKDKCLPESKIDDYCLSDRQCQLADPHSHCKWKISLVYGRCKCPPNYMTVKHNPEKPFASATSGSPAPHDRHEGRHHCLPRLGDACLTGTECLLATPNSLCRHPLASENLQLSWRTSNASARRCFCQDGFIESQDRLRCERVEPVLTQLADAPVMNQKHLYELLPASSGGNAPLSTTEEGSQEFDVTRVNDEPLATEISHHQLSSSSSPVPAHHLTWASTTSSTTTTYLNSTTSSEGRESSTISTTNSPVDGPTIRDTASTAPPGPPPTPASGADSSTSGSPTSPTSLNSDTPSSVAPSVATSQLDNTAARKISSLGKPCQHSDECQARDPNSHCLLGRCECLAPSAHCSANHTGCHQDTFQCRSTGQCISWYFVCDQFKNCDDGSDEDHCQVSGGGGGRCPPQAFQCGGPDGACVGRAKVCDGKRDCADGSDEQLCRAPDTTQPHHHHQTAANSSHCHPKAFTCDSGECVSGHAFCNAIDDCKDGSDENERFCQRSIIFNRKWAQTTSNGRPISAASERPPRFAHVPAPVRLIAETRISRASRGSRLIKGGLQFLGMESVDNLRRPQVECPAGSFTCSNGKCRSTAILCSGRDGCGDNSDENRCQVCQCPAPSSPSSSYN